MKPPLYYRLAIRVAKPIYRLLLSFNSEKRDSVGVVTQADEFAMRFARKFPEKVTTSATKPCVWVHAVSLGETNTVAPIIERLLVEGFELVITNTTHTGFARTQKLFGKRVNHTFITVDSGIEITKFLDYYQPKLALFMETELWANTLYQLSQHTIPSMLINARLTEKSFTGYAKFAKVSQSMMANISHIICQDEVSAQRFQQLGLAKDKVSLSPSLKFAVSTPKDARVHAEQLNKAWHLDHRQVIVAASTHEGEEAMLLAVFAELQKAFSDALLIIVPRHPERFDTVATQIESCGYTAYRRSADDEIDSDTQVYLADSMGELSIWYALSDIAVVGGSLVPDIGGHNPLEASVFAKPVIMGQYTHKCQYVVNALVAQNAMKVVTDHQVLYDTLFTWLDDAGLPKQLGANGATLVQQNKHTVQMQYALIEPFLPEFVSTANANQIS